MILPITGVASLFISLIIFFTFFATVSQIYWIPIIFVGSFLGLAILWTVSLIICTLFVDRKKPCRKHNPLFRFYAKCIIDSAIQIMRVKVHISGEDKLPEEKFLLVGNHVSYMDPVITMKVLRSYKQGFVGASDAIFKFPVMKNLLHKVFCLPIDRQSARDGVKMVNEAAEIIKSQKASMGIYPEGGRNLKGGLLPFRNGAFKIAKKANCPIVVAVIRGTENIKNNFPLRRTHVYLDFASVIQPEEFADLSTQEIGGKVREIIEEALRRPL